MMSIGAALGGLGKILLAIVAALHLYFLALEMFFWNKPLGLKTFRLTQDFANQSRALAANQGLYNGFLSAGLIWSLFITDPSFAFSAQSFFLACVTVAGIFGAATVSKKIFYVQALPAMTAWLALWISRSTF